jgi:hypothetical protein
MTDPVHAPPGWYPSAIEGEERWWSGVDWTAHARPTPVPVVPGPRATGTVWSGSKNGSLIGGVVCAVIAVFAAFGTLLALLSGTIMFLASALCMVACIAFSVILFLNYRGLSRNEAIARGDGARVDPRRG